LLAFSWNWNSRNILARYDFLVVSGLQNLAFCFVSMWYLLHLINDIYWICFEERLRVYVNIYVEMGWCCVGCGRIAWKVFKVLHEIKCISFSFSFLILHWRSNLSPINHIHSANHFLRWLCAFIQCHMVWNKDEKQKGTLEVEFITPKLELQKSLRYKIMALLLWCFCLWCVPPKLKY